MSFSLHTFDKIRQLSAAAVPEIAHAHDVQFNRHQFNKRGFMWMADNVLSVDECNNLIKSTLQKDNLAHEYLPVDRDSTRSIVESNELAFCLQKRVLSLINESLPETLRPTGFGTSGKWKLAGLNPCFRFSTYRPGSGGFKAHRDGAFVKNSCERSILTLLIYLNQPSENTNNAGGETTLFGSEYFQAGSTIAHEMARNPSVKHFIAPRTGRCVVFTQDVLHQGEPVVGWEKHILRADVVFKRTIDTQDKSDILWYAMPDFHRALALYQKAFALELSGDVAGASDCYERGNSYRVATVYTEIDATPSTLGQVDPTILLFVGPQTRVLPRRKHRYTIT